MDWVSNDAPVGKVIFIPVREWCDEQWRWRFEQKKSELEHIY
jgi:hypothetical protein